MEKPPNNLQLKEAAVKPWKNLTNEETNNLVTSVGHRLDALLLNKVIESKGYATRYYLSVRLICSYTFAYLRNCLT